MLTGAPLAGTWRKTFHDAKVVKESEKFLMIKVDLTKKVIPIQYNYWISIMSKGCLL
jgi:hypothetical protein